MFLIQVVIAYIILILKSFFDDILVHSNMCIDLILQSHYLLIILFGRTKRLPSHLTAQRYQDRKILPNVSKRTMSFLKIINRLSAVLTGMKNIDILKSLIKFELIVEKLKMNHDIQFFHLKRDIQR